MSEHQRYQKALDDEKERLDRIMASLERKTRQAALDGEPLFEHALEEHVSGSHGLANLDQEAWTLSSSNFWVVYLARVTQYS